MKKAIVIGDSNSIFIKSYIENVLLGSYDIILLQEGYLSQSYKDYYLSKGVHLEPLWIPSNSWTKRLPIIRSMFGIKLWTRSMLNKYGGFDLVHVHGLSRSRCEIAMSLKEHSLRIVLTVWGGDLLRRTDKQLLGYKKYYDSADYITVATEKMKDALLRAYGNYLALKTSIVGFPLVVLDLIDNLRGKISRVQICKDLGIDYKDKINVFVGHNGRDWQRHKELTKAITLLPGEIKDRINLIYTMTYGVPPQPYLNDLRQLAMDSGCSYSFVEGYQSEENIAKLRLLCDILLHAQPTDAASASFFECMYVGAICLNGSWLPYDYIQDYHKRVIEYDEVSQITSIVMEIVENYNDYKAKFSINEGFRNGYPSVKDNAKMWKKIIGISCT